MYSDEHIKFIKKRKRERFIVFIFQISIFISFIILWHLLSKFNIINTFIFSSPKKILETIINLYKNKDLFSHIGVTIYETFFKIQKEFLGHRK